LQAITLSRIPYVLAVINYYVVFPLSKVSQEWCCGGAFLCINNDDVLHARRAFASSRLQSRNVGHFTWGHASNGYADGLPASPISRGRTKEVGYVGGAGHAKKNEILDKREMVTMLLVGCKSPTTWFRARGVMDRARGVMELE
jgi:hypothetical protein